MSCHIGKIYITQASEDANSAILTADKQGDQSVCQHHEWSTDWSSFTDGGHRG